MRSDSINDLGSKIQVDFGKAVRPGAATALRASGGEDRFGALEFWHWVPGVTHASVCDFERSKQGRGAVSLVIVTLTGQGASISEV
jgi:hypothetical protein